SFCIALPLHAGVTRVWQTGGPNALWSSSFNWSPVGVPSNNDTLRFVGTGDTTINDLNGLVVHDLFIEHGNWRITGNEFSVLNSITVGELTANPGFSPASIECPILLTTPNDVEILVRETWTLNIRGQIRGTSTFFKQELGTLILQHSNTFTGDLRVGAGIVDVRDNRALGDAAGGVILTDGSITLSNAIVSSKTLFVRGTRPVTANTAGSFLKGLGLSAWFGPIALDTNLVVYSVGLCILGGPVAGPGGFEFLGENNALVGASVQPNPSTFTGLTRVLCE